MDENKCSYCKATKVRVRYINKYHKYKKEHGPFNFGICDVCRSGQTYPLPSPDQLRDLYNSFDGGMNSFTRNVRENNPLVKWYNQCVDNAILVSECNFEDKASFSWIDVGAGNGEISALLAERFPASKGVAVDFHDRPAKITHKNIDWIKIDLNEEFSKHFKSTTFDLVLSITVLEHVLFPEAFIKNLIDITNKTGGTMYVTCPDMGSVAARYLNKFWPYLIWGEHLSIPSTRGLQALIHRLMQQEKLEGFSTVRPVMLPYPINYYLDNFGLSFLKFAFHKKMTLPINTGILEGFIRLAC